MTGITSPHALSDEAHRPICESQGLAISYQSPAQARLVPRCRPCPRGKSRHGTIPGTMCAVAVQFSGGPRVSSRDVYCSQGDGGVTREFTPP